MRKLVLGFSICLFLVMFLTVAVSGSEVLFAPELNGDYSLADWRQVGPGQWSLYAEDGQSWVVKHENKGYDESILYYEKYELPLTFTASVRIKGTPDTSMYYWKGLVFYVDSYEFYIVRFSYGRDEANVQCNRYRIEDGKISLLNYSAGTLPQPIPPGEEVELVVKRQLVKVDIIVNGTLVQFTPLLMSLPQGAKIGFYNVSANETEDCPAYFWDLEVTGL